MDLALFWCKSRKEAAGRQVNLLYFLLIHTHNLIPFIPDLVGKSPWYARVGNNYIISQLPEFFPIRVPETIIRTG